MDIYSLRPIGHFLISPINHTLVLIVCVWLLTLFKPSWRVLNKISFVIGACWLFLCSQTFFSHKLISPLDSFAPIVKASDSAIQNNSSIFVLACFLEKQKDLPIVSGWHECSLQRLVQAAIVYKQNPVPIFISGGDFLVESKPSYSESAEKLLLGLGVKQSDILLVAKGTNTMEEMTAVYPLLPEGQVAIISSSTHMNRITKFDQHLKQQLLNNQPEKFSTLLVPVDHIVTRELNLSPNFPASYSIEIVERALYEYLAIAVHEYSGK
jgi:uncharacterized SAM-binding protein YcdF (DUF218 family)